MSHRTHRSRKQFRRSPLSDLLAALAGIVLVVLLVLLVRTLLKPPSQPGGDNPAPPASSGEPSSPPPASQSPEPSRPPASQSPEEPSQPPVSPDPEPSSTQPDEAGDIPWYLTLVNRDHPLEEGFVPETTPLTNGMVIDTRAYDALSRMLSDCRAAGLQPVVCSAYRSLDDQTFLFQRKINYYMADGLSYDEAYAATAVEIAIPGTSEHSLGLSADICALSYQLLDEAQADTAEQQWLMAHCTEYGFVLRYPKDKEEITGIIYEPWHYRYVGLDAAKEITEQGLCLEEYLQQKYQLS